MAAETRNAATYSAVFGTLKHWMGWTHVLTRGIQNVATEMSLSVLVYSFKRVLSILGFEQTMKALRLLCAWAPIAVVSSLIYSPRPASGLLRSVAGAKHSEKKLSRLRDAPL